MPHHIVLSELFILYCHIELQHQLFANVDDTCNTERMVGLKIVYIIVPVFLTIYIVFNLGMAELFCNDI